MSLSCICPNCDKQYSKIKSELAGKKVRCSCGHKIRLPHLDHATESSVRLKKRIESDKPKTASRSDGEIKEDPFDLDYDDLDKILNRSDFADDVLQPSDQFKKRLQQQSERQANAPFLTSPPSPRPNSALPNTTRNEPTPNHPPNPSRLGMWLLLTLVSGTLSACLGSILIAAKYTATFNHPLLDELAASLRQIYLADFGLPAVTSTLVLGFTVSGWAILCLAAGLVLMSVLLHLQALAQVFSCKPWFPWIDGWLATISFLLILVLMGTLFLQQSHFLNVNREIQAQTPLLDNQSPPPQLVRLRQQLTEDRNSFQFRILGLGILPASIFAVSMLRLFVRDSWTQSTGAI